MGTCSSHDVNGDGKVDLLDTIEEIGKVSLVLALKITEVLLREKLKSTSEDDLKCLKTKFETKLFKNI